MIGIFLKILVTVFFLGLAGCQQNNINESKPRMIDIKRLLKAYGFENGIVEGVSSNTSDEGYIMVTFIQPYGTSDKNVIRIVKEEMPPNRIGALRIFSLWLFKIAYRPENRQYYIENIEDLRNNWLKKGISLTLIAPVKGEYKIPPMTFTDAEIMEYYSKAIRNKIEGIKLKPITGDEAKQFRELLITYCVTPTKQNAAVFTSYAKRAASASPAKSKAIDSFMNELSPELKKTLGL